MKLDFETVMGILKVLAENVPAIADAANHFLAEKREPSPGEWKELLASAGVPFDELWPETVEE